MNYFANSKFYNNISQKVIPFLVLWPYSVSDGTNLTLTMEIYFF